MNDESYIKLTLELAKKGLGKVSPNPMVGCVIVKDNRIIGAGFHEKYGHNHAEINAINNSSEDIESATIYINLEPCSHYGKTPPCINKLIERKVKRVVIGTLDMNPLVGGKSVQQLVKNGIEVKVGILENECIELNKFFFKHITTKLPYVTLKIAQTIDGKIADVNYNSKWITSKASRKFVHNLRASYDAVLVGKGTIVKDNPNLTVRFSEGRNPKRIVFDSKLSLKLNFKIFQNDNNIILVTSKNSANKTRKIKVFENYGVKILFANEDTEGRINIKNALKVLARNNIASVLIEGGHQIFTSFIKDKLFDDMKVFISPKILGNGLSGVGSININSIQKAMQLVLKNVERIDDDVILDYKKN